MRVLLKRRIYILRFVSSRNIRRVAHEKCLHRNIRENRETLQLMRTVLTIMILLFCCYTLIAQSSHSLLRDADKAYEGEKYIEAETDYRRSLQKKHTAKGKYNLGNAIYKQGNRYEEAIRHYEEAAKTAKTRKDKAHAYHNLGNAYFKSEDLKRSVEAYKEALRLNPYDEETLHNLSAVQMELIKPPPPEGKESDQKPEEEQQQQQQNEEEHQNQDGQEQQQPQQPGEEDPQSQEQAGNPEEMNREEAERLLEIMEREEQKVVEKQKNMNLKKKRKAKDW